MNAKHIAGDAKNRMRDPGVDLFSRILSVPIEGRPAQNQLVSGQIGFL